MPEPLYTSSNCTPAYELRWSLALFSTADLSASDVWLNDLKAAVEADGVRILECRCEQHPVLHFLLSTKPAITPPQIVKSVKGRLQHCIRDMHPAAFRRNFSMASVGDVRREVIESYCAISESPETVALTYLNNLAYAHGMQPLFCCSYYVGTFGEYDMDAIRRSL